MSRLGVRTRYLPYLGDVPGYLKVSTVGTGTVFGTRSAGNEKSAAVILARICASLIGHRAADPVAGI